jgi:lactoylglutathione lyase
LELTHNWDQEEHYDKGNGWGHLCIETSDVHKAFEALTAQGAEIISPPGPMSHGTRILAFLKDPDGYVVELNETINLN